MIINNIYFSKFLVLDYYIVNIFLKLLHKNIII